MKIGNEKFKIVLFITISIFTLLSCQSSSKVYIESKSIEIFFPNRIKDPHAEYCDRGYPVYRTLHRASSLLDSVKFAIGEYLKGPTKIERDSGFSL